MSEIISALEQIRISTTFLWPELRSLAPEASTFTCQIRASTFQKVVKSLECLSEAGLLRFSTLPAYHNREEWILRLHLSALTPQLRAYAQQLDETPAPGRGRSSRFPAEQAGSEAI